MVKKIFSIVLFTLVFSANASQYDLDPIFDASGVDNNFRKVKRELAKGISINAKDHVYGSTPLIFAAYWGNRNIVLELIKRGANINAQDNDGWTALMYAAKWAKDDVVADLLAAGANPNLTANDGSTALMDAAYILWGSKKAAKALIKAGAQVNAQENSGWTALMYAARYNKHETVADLLNARANPNITANDGTTALMEAAGRGNPKVCKLLLATGADVSAENRDGTTALDLAIKSLTYAHKNKLRNKDMDDKKRIQRLEKVCSILCAHEAKVAAEKTQTTTEGTPLAAKRRTTRWQRWKTNILKFFKRS